MATPASCLLVSSRYEMSLPCAGQQKNCGLLRGSHQDMRESLRHAGLQDNCGLSCGDLIKTCDLASHVLVMRDLSQLRM